MPTIYFNLPLCTFLAAVLAYSKIPYFGGNFGPKNPQNYVKPILSKKKNYPYDEQSSLEKCELISSSEKIFKKNNASKMKHYCEACFLTTIV